MIWLVCRLTTDELWKLYESITEALADRIIAEKQALDSKLALLKQQGVIKAHAVGRQRTVSEKRKYPKVHQKFWNPDDPSQTWSGRGKQPHWIARLLKAGTQLDELIIPQYGRATRAA